jgi:hypothetical protein
VFKKNCGQVDWCLLLLTYSVAITHFVKLKVQDQSINVDEHQYGFQKLLKELGK